MFEIEEINHHIQKHVLAYLMEHEYARFRDLRPPKTDTNLYSYHLKLLQKRQFVEKTEQGYTLGVKGALYVDRINADSVKLSPQPKVVTMAIIQNQNGDVLMYDKVRQPFIGRLTVPFGKVHNSDSSIRAAVEREVEEKVGDIAVEFAHVGDCYIRVRAGNEVILSTLAHVFYGETNDEEPRDHMKWVSPRALAGSNAAPAVEKVIARTFFHDPYFFEEYDEAW